MSRSDALLATGVMIGGSLLLLACLIAAFLLLVR